MIRYYSPKMFLIARLDLPGDIKSRMNTPSVQRLAASLKRTGGRTIHPVTVSRSGHKLLMGCDRVAAAMVANEASIWGQEVEGTPEEMATIVYEENAARRNDDPEELRAEYAAALDAIGSSLLSDADSQRTSAPNEQETSCVKPTIPVTCEMTHQRPLSGASDNSLPRGARTKAIREVAKRRGLSESTVRRAVQDEAPVAPQSCIDGGGCVVPEDVDASARMVQGIIDEALRHIAAAKKAIAQLEHTDCPTAIYQHCADDVHQLEHRVKNARPTMLCPHCRAGKKVRKDCLCCATVGWIRREQEQAIPSELMDPAKPMAQERGKIVPAEKVGALLAPRQTEIPEDEDIPDLTVEPDPEDPGEPADGMSDEDVPF